MRITPCGWVPTAAIASVDCDARNGHCAHEPSEVKRVTLPELEVSLVSGNMTSVVSCIQVMHVSDTNRDPYKGCSHGSPPDDLTWQREFFY